MWTELTGAPHAPTPPPDAPWPPRISVPPAVRRPRSWTRGSLPSGSGGLLSGSPKHGRPRHSRNSLLHLLLGYSNMAPKRLFIGRLLCPAARVLHWKDQQIIFSLLSKLPPSSRSQPEQRVSTQSALHRGASQPELSPVWAALCPVPRTSLRHRLTASSGPSALCCRDHCDAVCVCVCVCVCVWRQSGCVHCKWM